MYSDHVLLYYTCTFQLHCENHVYSDHVCYDIHARSLVLQLHCERDSAVEAVEVWRQGVEEELQRCRDRLRAVQVERNLLLVSTVDS